MSTLRHQLATSNNPFAMAVRSCRRAVLNFTLPAPAFFVRPLLAVFLLLRAVYEFFFRVLVCEPLFKAYCEEYGRGVRTGDFIHWVEGSGRLIIGDDVLLDGKCSISFAARYTERPVLKIGSHTIVSHNCSFTVGREIVIGNHCLIAMGARLFDSPGHPIDPVSRKAGNPANPEDVRPIAIHDNAWIGTDAVIFPGVTVGEGSVVVTGAYVVSDVPPYTMVAGNPARAVRRLPGYVAPSNSQEDSRPIPTDVDAHRSSAQTVEDLLAIIRQTLGAEVLSPTEDFYDAGMTSIMALPLLVQIEQHFGIELSENDFLDARTAAELADFVDKARIKT